MSIQQKQVSYCTEVDSFLSLIVTLIKDVKAKKSVGEDIADLLPAFMAALTGLGDLSVELDNYPALANTVELKVNDMVEAFLVA